MDPGYRPTEEVEALVVQLARLPRLPRVALALAQYHASILALPLGFVLGARLLCSALIWPLASTLLVLLTPVIALIVARGFRGLENMVHDGSHYHHVKLSRTSRNHRRIQKRFNDILTNLTAAAPTLQLVQNYRRGHQPHHVRFGIAVQYENHDPERERFRKLGFEDIDWSDGRSYWRTARLAFVGYVADWCSGLRLAAVIRGVAWWMCVLTAVHIVFGTEVAVAMALFNIAVFLFVLLPFRMVAETQEHRFSAGDSQIETTYSNVGILNAFLHPNGDGYHAEHHIWEQLPSTRLPHLGKRLLHEPDWRTKYKARTRMMEVPHALRPRT